MRKVLLWFAMTLLAALSVEGHAAPQNGYWWNPAEPGRGYFLEIQGNTMFMAAFLYDASGRATWLGSTGSMTTATQYSGPLTTYTGAWTMSGPNGQSSSPNNIGALSISFSSDTTGILTWPGGTIPIQRFDIVPGGSTTVQSPVQLQTGWWWCVNQPGRGFAIEVQNGSVYLAGYMYDNSGNPTWYLAANTMLGQSYFFSDWAVYGNGQTLTGPFRPASILNPSYPYASMQIANPTSATLSLGYDPIQLTRFNFGSPTPFAVTEFSSGLNPGAVPDSIAAGADGNLWFNLLGGDHRIGRITPAGVITLFGSVTLPNSYIVAMTAGPDGNVWFADRDAGAIGRITPQGTITEFDNGGSLPSAITAGPDGNVWFLTLGGQIGRVTPNGDIKRYTTGISSILDGIVAGPDGNMWFTEYDQSRIGKITMAGVVSEFSAGISAGAKPYGITAGLDGNLWFTEFGGKNIGRITPTGVVTEFPAYSGVGGLGGQNIVTDHDGNFWFTQLSGTAITRITPTGTLMAVTAGISDGASVHAITVGPDGNIWFTEYGGGRIGRLSIH